MQKREIKDGIFKLGSIDWDRRLFDSLIPLPDGTSYNSYLICGSEKTVLIDSVDPVMSDELMDQLSDVKKIDYIISNHAEQDHSGSIPVVLKRYPDAKVVATPKAKGILIDLLHIDENAFVTVEDGETIPIGNKTLKFIHTPWVHWPETMVTYLVEDNILFSCDFFGSHIATSDIFVTDQGRVHEAAKRYFAEIMMPFRNVIEKNLEKLKGYEIRMIAPSHGQVYDKPQWIMDAYKEWVTGGPKNLVSLPFISMHGSTRVMVERLLSGLTAHGVSVDLFNLAVTDIGKLAMSLVDAATIVVGAPTVLAGPHPVAAYAAFLANAIRPRTKFLSIIGSYEWGGKTVETLAGMIPNLKVEVIEPVLCKGLPKEADLLAIDKLAQAIADKHRGIGLI
ncbi:MAG: FprA family A-type flavoprotein [Deltaproteobacteria bacterium]|nr:FprA family A-type flavoprotein [Deltaproteobacteria bacterium]